MPVRMTAVAAIVFCVLFGSRLYPAPTNGYSDTSDSAALTNMTSELTNSQLSNTETSADVTATSDTSAPASSDDVTVIDRTEQMMSPLSLDVTAGSFFPLAALGEGMGASFILGVRGLFPLVKILPGDFRPLSPDILRSIDLGGEFSFVKGTALVGRDASLLMMSFLFDVSYRLPVFLKGMDIALFNGLGVTSVIAFVNTTSNTVTNASSTDFTLRPGIGFRYEFIPHFFARADFGFQVCFESVSALGLVLSLGGGYAF